MALGFELEIVDRIAFVTLDDPDRSVNTLGSSALAAFRTVVERLENEKGLRGVVVLSAKSESFVVGADLDELATLETAEQACEWVTRGQELLERWARLRMPSVAGILGAALGGGLEVALACTWRVAADHPATSLGLPEVQLGLIPALGGTYRLPRTVGFERGVQMLLTGRRLNARQAMTAGLVDQMVSPEELREATLQWIDKGMRRAATPWRERLLAGNPIGRRFLLAAARRRTLSKTGGHYPAPLQILQAVETGYARGREAGLTSEAWAFGELATSEVSRNLVRLFLATRAPGGESRTPPPAPKLVGVIGAGFMGSGIAAAAAREGVSVQLVDSDAEALDRAMLSCRRRFESLERRQKLAPDEARGALSCIQPSPDLGGLGEADLVVEAVFEDPEVKKKLLRQLEPHLRQDAVVGSNTSTIPIAELSSALERPERLLGIHFFSPVHRMPLVEIIRHPGTSQETIDRTLSFIRLLGKIPIVVRDGPGFYTSRVLSPYLAQGAGMLLEGASISAVDSAAREAGFPVGPLELLDEVGIDIAAHAARTLARAFPDRMAGPRAFRALVEAGRLGRKSGRGFYDYSGKKKRPDLGVLELLPIPPKEKTPPADELAERLLLAMSVEAVRCLEDGIIDHPRVGDVGAVLGLGFPPFRGGPFSYLDALGAAEALTRLEALAVAHGPVFEPPQLLRQQALRGEAWW